MSYQPTPDLPDDHTRRSVQSVQWTLFSIIVIAMFGAVAAWTLNGAGVAFWESGVYFILIPGSMAALLSIAPLRAGRTSYGVARGTTIAILASAILLREGFICVLMALPLIIPIIALVTWAARPDGRSRYSLLVPLLLVGASAEGIAFELPKNVEVTEVRVIDATPDQLNESLDGRAELPEIEPLLFALPLPAPVDFVGEGSDLGDRRIVEFEMGRLVLEVTQRTNDSITWSIAENTTPLAGWMTLHDVRMFWTPTDAGLELHMTITFDRELAPAFYFDPLERWGVGEMAEVLLDMIEVNIDA